MRAIHARTCTAPALPARYPHGPRSGLGSPRFPDLLVSWGSARAWAQDLALGTKGVRRKVNCCNFHRL